MKKHKKSKIAGLPETEIAVGYLYFTTANQYRAVLAIKGEFLIYAPSSEGMEPIDSDTANMPFENAPFKKCQIATFAKKEYQPFEFNGTQSIKHQLSEAQLVEAIAQCNAKSAIAGLLAE
jgi:hypothetical protein